MLIPFSWLSEYVDITLPPAELAHRLTMAGIEVGEVTARGGWNGCVVGYVRAARPHPNADALTLCQVDAGAGAPPAEVVCGAPMWPPARKSASPAPAPASSICTPDAGRNSNRPAFGASSPRG